MQSDEAEIRQLVSTWIAATEAGDAEKILSLVTKDVVFLVPGQPVMHLPEFAASTRSQAAQTGLQIDVTSEIQEIKVAGSWAFMWTRLSVVVSPPGAARPIRRDGHTLTILEKQNGKWLLSRDANMLAPVAD